MRQIPALVLPDGTLMTESAAMVLQLGFGSLGLYALNSRRQSRLSEANL